MRKPYLLLLGILILALVLRLYRVNENLVFHGELGHNYLAIKNFVSESVVPLLGPPTSHPWLSFGPLFYYIFTPFLVVNHWNPNTGGYFFAVMSVVGIVANYVLTKRYVNEKVALISCYLLAISPSWLEMARQARFFSMISYLFYFFALLVLKLSEKGQKKYFLVVGAILGVMVNFHLTVIILVPGMIGFLWKEKTSVTIEKVLWMGAGFLSVNLPFLIYNLQHNFEMVSKFLVWLPYRSVIYRDFDVKFTLGEIYWFLGGIVSIPIVVTLFVERKRKLVRLFSWFLIFGVVGLILHKDPPRHYFYVLYPIPIIIVSALLGKLKPFLVMSVLVLTTSLYSNYLFSHKWFYTENVVRKNTVIPFKLQTEVAEKIINDSSGKPFNLHREGYSDQFEGEYAQNYRYLLWLKGNEPKDYETDVSYTIIEYPDMKVVMNQK